MNYEPKTFNLEKDNHKNKNHFFPLGFLYLIWDTCPPCGKGDDNMHDNKSGSGIK